MRYAIYLLTLKEWNLDWLMSEYVWMPFKRAGRKISFTSFNISSIIFAVLLVSGIIDFQIENAITDYLHRFLPEFFALFGLILVLKYLLKEKMLGMHLHLF